MVEFHNIYHPEFISEFSASEYKSTPPTAPLKRGRMQSLSQKFEITILDVRSITSQDLQR